MKGLNVSFCCLNGGHRVNQCKLKRSCGWDGCTRLRNKLLHRHGNDQQSHLTDSGANPVLTVNAESGILQVVLIKLSNSVNLVDT